MHPKTKPDAPVEQKVQSQDFHITVRPMILDDLDQVVAIDQNSFSLPWPAHSFRYELMENDVARLWVAEIDINQDNPQVVGMMVVWLILDEAHIATIAVDPRFRRLGVARQMIHTAMQECATMGARSATLEVRENNLNAIDLYHKLEFKVVGRRKRYYKDTNEDAILMTMYMKTPENLLTRPNEISGSNGGKRESR